MKAGWWFGLVLAVAVGASLPAGAQPSLDVEYVPPSFDFHGLLTEPPTYSVKFLCGTILLPGGELAPGEYQTAINIHNLRPSGISFTKKAAVALAGQTAGPVSAPVGESLGPNEALEMNCEDIRTLLEDFTTPFLKGFVVLENPAQPFLLPLQVVAVYTVSPLPLL